MSEYSVLTQGGLKKTSKPLLVIMLCIFAIGSISLIVSHLDFTPTTVEYLSPDNASSLIIRDGKSYVNGTQVYQIYPPKNVSIIDKYKTWIVANSSWNGFPLFGFGLLCSIIVIMYLFSANVSGGTIMSLFPKRLRSKKKDIIPELNISPMPKGFAAMRAWTMTKDGWLKSTARGVVWQGCKVKADVEPRYDSVSGIYAFRLGTRLDELDFMPFQPKVWGVVSLAGRIIGHGDGIVRASTCVVLYLMVKHEKDAEKLRLHYDCPILVLQNPVKTIRKWVISSQGVQWLAHNAQLVEGSRGNRYLTEIDEVLESKQL